MCISSPSNITLATTSTHILLPSAPISDSSRKYKPCNSHENNPVESNECQPVQECSVELYVKFEEIF